MTPRRSFVPYLSPADWLIIKVWANQLVRYSGPSTVRLKSFWALICSSQLIGGIKSAAPTLAFLNISLMSGFSCSPEPVVITPSLNAYQRPISSSRVMICATRLCSFTRALNFGCRRAACLRSCAAPNRMIGNLSLANAIVSSSFRATAREPVPRGVRAARRARFCNNSIAIETASALFLPSPRLGAGIVMRYMVFPLYGRVRLFSLRGTCEATRVHHPSRQRDGLLALRCRGAAAENPGDRISALSFAPGEPQPPLGI